MKITSRLLSIPPFISASWQRIASLHLEQRNEQWILIIDLVNASRVEIPHLPRPLIDEIFSAHSRYLERSQLSLLSQGNSFPFRHDPSQRDIASLPESLLQKLSVLIQAFGLEISPPEEGCNCIACQISRLVEEDDEEEELQIQLWDVEEVETNLFQVRNALDKEESYRVFLGHPMGCTCGKERCEHIRAVLES